MSKEQVNELSPELVEQYEKQIICDGCDEIIPEDTEIFKKDIFWIQYNFCCLWCLTDFENHIRKSYLRNLMRNPPLENPPLEKVEPNQSNPPLENPPLEKVEPNQSNSHLEPK